MPGLVEFRLLLAHGWFEMDAVTKLKIVDKARALGLWEEPAKLFKETQRQALRTLEVPKREAVHKAWSRLDRMLTLVSTNSEPFEMKASLEWSDLITDYESHKQRFDRESGWVFVHYGDENLVPRSKFTEQLIQFGNQDPAWFFIVGARYFSTACLDKSTALCSL